MTKMNNVLDLQYIGKATWNFIFSLYKLGWDLLITNKDKQSFR